MGAFIQFFKDEWAVISGAPVSFVLLSLLLGFIGYRIGRWQMKERVENAEKARDLARERAEGKEPEKPTKLNIV